MSLESKLDALTTAVLALTAQLQSGGAPAPVQAPVVPVAAPVTLPSVPFPVTPAPPLPPAPFPAAPAAPAAPALFTDTAGLVAFATDRFHHLESLGAGKGHLITDILTGWGIDDMAKIPPAGFQAFYDAVMALR